MRCFLPESYRNVHIKPSCVTQSTSHLFSQYLKPAGHHLLIFLATSIRRWFASYRLSYTKSGYGYYLLNLTLVTGLLGLAGYFSILYPACLACRMVIARERPESDASRKVRLALKWAALEILSTLSILVANVWKCADLQYAGYLRTWLCTKFHKIRDILPCLKVCHHWCVT